ncbi:hypothetical protein AB0J72_50100 [Dactylosporangium sp. NPDC049742]|uniref:hypothetical protein n=1 Tax=Dactylosporangium sp. NPDC049742 TaxID=3154737 RepID=UPI003443E276
MIYDSVEPDEPIRQGDIFRRIPKIDFNLARMVAISPSKGPVIGSWETLEHAAESSTIAVNVMPVLAVVISQDCDASRSEDISFCEVRPFEDVDGKAKNFANLKPKARQSIITTHARVNQKWFYMPSDDSIGILEPMAVDFRIPIRLPRENIETMRAANRIGRLNEVSSAHFRERISEFFRRYPYDEWYPLSSDELREYPPSKYGLAPPFPWQRDQSSINDVADSSLQSQVDG